MVQGDDNEKEDPPNSLEREGVIKNDLGWRSPWGGGGRKGASDQRPPSMLEPVLGGVHSPSSVAPPG